MTVAIPSAPILCGLGLRGQAHGATPTAPGGATSLNQNVADRARSAAGTCGGDLGAVQSGVTVDAERQTVRYLVAQRRRRMPGDRMVGVQSLSRAAVLAGIAISGEDSAPPLLVAVTPSESGARCRLIGARGEVSAFLTAELHRVAALLLERRTASLARQRRRSMCDLGAGRRARRVAVSRATDERLTTPLANDCPARLAVGVARRRDLEVGAASATGSREPVRLRHPAHGSPVHMSPASRAIDFDLIRAAGDRARLLLSGHHPKYTRFQALERLSGMGITPRLADG